MGNTVIQVPDAARYGRTQNGAETARDEWWGRMGAGDQQQGVIAGALGTVNNAAATGAGHTTAVEDGSLVDNEASGAGGHQNAALGMAQSLASGNQPSQAAYQLQSGLNQASAQQSAAARGARGGAALATADANRAANVSNLQQNAYAQGGLLRSKDMAAGRGMLTSGLAQMRDQDNARLGQGNEFGQFNAGAENGYKLGMGNAAVGIGAAADAYEGLDKQNYDAGMNPIKAQTEGEQGFKRWISSGNRQAVAANNED